MSLFSDFFAPNSESTVRATIVGYAKAAGLILTNFIKGSVPDQLLEAMTASGANNSALISQLVRGRGSLDTACDPGDFDPYDPTNAADTPKAGFLSEYGAGQFGTDRIGETFARGIARITNSSGSAIYISPEQVTFARDTPDPDTGLSPTYRNEADATIYTNPDGTATIANGAYLDVTIVAEESGIASNAGANHVVLETNLGTGVTATNAAAILASVREEADAYRARCRIAPAILSLAGPADAYKVIALAAQKDEDGNIFFFPPWGDGVTAIGVDTDGNFAVFPNARGTSLGVNRVFVDADSSTGETEVWFADASGDPGAQVLTDLTALFDAIYLPENVTRTFHRAVEVPVTIEGAVRAKAGAGVSADSIATAINAAIEAAFPLYEIGGYDQTAGAGTLYKEEIDATVNGAHTKIYKVTLSSPSGDTALAKGRVAVPVNTIDASDITIT